MRASQTSKILVFNKNMDTSEEDLKKTIRMESIYKALEDGWTVKKSSTGSKTFEFTRTSGEKSYNDEKHSVKRKSISAPIVKNPKKNTT